MVHLPLSLFSRPPEMVDPSANAPLPRRDEPSDYGSYSEPIDEEILAEPPPTKRTTKDADHPRPGPVGEDRGEDRAQRCARARAPSGRGISTSNLHTREHEHHPRYHATRHLFHKSPLENLLTVVKRMLQNPPLRSERGMPAEEWFVNVEQLGDTTHRNAANKSYTSQSRTTTFLLAVTGTGGMTIAHATGASRPRRRST